MTEILASTEALDELAARASRLAEKRPRAIIGIAGSPGSGKSTVAAGVAERLKESGDAVAIVPMDGFHLAQRELDRRGRADRKGAPDTFDAAGYVALLRRLRDPAEGVVYAPEYVRGAVEQPIGSAIPVSPAVRIVLTEGNYLLLTEPPWSLLRPLLDETWFLQADPDARRARLYERHLANGKTRERAHAFTHGSDESNARLVEATAASADVLVHW